MLRTTLMSRSTLAARVVAPLALAALAVGMPAAAVAEPTPTPSVTASDSVPAEPTATASPSTTTSPTETASPAPSTAPSESAETPEPSATSSATPSATSSASPSGTTVPFGTAKHTTARLPGTTMEQAAFAAGYLERTLAAQSDHYTYPNSTYFDGGNTIDAILGLDGAHVGLTQADASFDYLDANIGGYIGTDFDSFYAGPGAKALLAVVAQGGDPSDLGGVDLVDLLLNESLGAVEPGRFSDLPVDCGFDPCDYSNTVGQSLGIIAVGRATGAVPEEAITFLLDQQCADGSFRGSMEGEACTADLDATAFAIQALIGAGEDEAAAAALDFLASRQHASGGFLNADGTFNTNTTGVAAQAFAAAGRSAELASAQGFLADLQLDCTFAASLRGGIAFSAADRATLLASPTDQEAIDRLLRSTPQATLGLAGGSLLEVTADGAAAAAPDATCATTPTPTPTTGTATPTPGTQTPPTEPSETTDAEAASGGSGPLAYTGSSVEAPLALAGVLLLVGATFVALSRRRGAHA